MDWSPLVTALATGLAAGRFIGKELILSIYKDVAQPGVQQVGKAIGGCLGLGNTFLWFVHFANGVAAGAEQIAIKSAMDRLATRLSPVPIDNISVVSTEIGVPLLERLGYCRDPQLSELIIEMLASASTAAMQESVHPAFLQIILSLSPDDIRLLKMLRHEKHFPTIRAEWHSMGGITVTPTKNFCLQTLAELPLDFPEIILPYVENLDRLGLLFIGREGALMTERYENMERSRREEMRIAEVKPPAEGLTLHFVRGTISLSDFGLMFTKAGGKVFEY